MEGLSTNYLFRIAATGPSASIQTAGYRLQIVKGFASDHVSVLTIKYKKPLLPRHYDLHTWAPVQERIIAIHPPPHLPLVRISPAAMCLADSQKPKWLRQVSHMTVHVAFLCNSAKKIIMDVSYRLKND